MPRFRLALLVALAVATAVTSTELPPPSSEAAGTEDSPPPSTEVDSLLTVATADTGLQEGSGVDSPVTTEVVEEGSTVTTDLEVDGSSVASFVDVKKEEVVEVESETPVISFGIRSFTVEVGTGTERSEDEPAVLVNVTGSENGTVTTQSSTAVEVSSTMGGVASTTEEVGSTVVSSTAGSTEQSHVEVSLASVTVNTKISQEKVVDESGEDQDQHNEIRVEKKNGLYRIKIAEITTDEFDNGLHETDGESLMMPADLGAPKSVYPAKINIDDFYPSKLEDFKPAMEPREEEMEEKLLREKAILRNEESANLFEATIMKPSDVLPVIDSKTDSYDEEGKKGEGDISTTKIEIELIDDTSETSTSDEGKSVAATDNITEKLEENDEVISRIEENFKTFDEDVEFTHEEAPAVAKPKDDEVITIAISSVTFSSSQQLLSTQAPPTPSPLAGTTGAQAETTTTDEAVPVSGSDIVKDNFGSLFIPRRVKKNDPTTSKINIFNSATGGAPLKKIDFANTKFNTDPSSGHNPADKKDKPEFSTTKFYNSKELYSELHHQVMNDSDHHRPAKKPTAVVSEKDILTAKTLSTTSTTKKTPPTRIPIRRPEPPSSDIKKKLLQTNFIPREDHHTTQNPTPENTSVNRPAHHPQDQQKKIKTLGAAASAIIAATSKLMSKDQRARPTPLTAGSENLITRPGITAHHHQQQQQRVSRLQEKINTLDCDIQQQLTGVELASVWRGNETHELELPIMTPEDCSAGSSCIPTTISWEGTADIQSGDVLIVEIDDKHLIPSNYNKSAESSHHATTAVYQVTRLGHEHCDITEGVLLDITPLIVDGKKLVTLYDKDLTEGINLLIVVSEQWGQQCVRLKVTVKSDNCGENADCSGKGVCYSNNSMEGYECQCCSGFAGSHCEEIDACTPSPCTNNGICVDLSQGHEGNAYQCLCPYGYTGKNCQFESDPCNPSQCLNGGTCVGNSTHFRCDCTSGYTGPLCQHNLNECESSPCVHGICVDQEDGFRCFCQPGFSGELCNFEYNECESNPCINGGQCIDNIGGFSCKCTRGYTGKRCHIKVDFCANDPCPDGHRCIDHGDDFTCECPGGRNGPDCNQVPRTLCNVNPCANGGTCWTTEESFYCACRPGFTGKMCEENFVIDSVVSSSEMLSDNLSQNGQSGHASSAIYGLDSEARGIGKRAGAIELHNAYIAAGTLAAAILIVAIVVIACHCKVHQSYRHFATKHRQLIPIFGRKTKASSAANRHWLSGKGQQQQGCQQQQQQGGQQGGHSNLNYSYGQHPNSYSLQPERIINKPLPMNLENDMYYTVDFGESQHAPLIQ
ncbi:hypothetical protein quinque_009848 [Culex quinquefasciatus]